jgi:hypothetical protein
MSKINGEKARASIARRQRNAQRVKSRAAKAALVVGTEAKPAAKAPSVKKAKA